MMTAKEARELARKTDDDRKKKEIEDAINRAIQNEEFPLYYVYIDGIMEHYLRDWLTELEYDVDVDEEHDRTIISW